MYDMHYQFGIHRCINIIYNNYKDLNIFLVNKFDHMMECYKQLQWLNLDQLIQFHLACVMFHQYHDLEGNLFLPPIQFGNTTSHYTI